MGIEERRVAGRRGAQGGAPGSADAGRTGFGGYHYGRIRLASSPLKSLARLLLLPLLLAAAAGFGLYRWAHRPLAMTSGPGREATILPGSSVRAIGRQFEEAGVPMNAWLFEAWARLAHPGVRLQAGTYAIDATLTPDLVVEKMARGDVVKIALVIPEGWTFAQMRAAVAARTDLKGLTTTMSDAELMTAVGGSTAHPEGMFFPDTYQYTRGSSDLDLYRRAYRALQKRLDDAWAARSPDLPLATPYEALTLASIVEKETGLAEDRPQIAAVFVNRLKRGMPLQTDPAVIYGLGARFDGNLRRTDLARDTPYNTYLHTGLPPTPIALVGTASLAAAVNPPRSDALYFVARGDGSSAFSPSLNEHNRAVDRYQREPARRPGRAP